MILSVSRRTDIPRFYFDWFLNRLKAGFVLVRNPMNFHQVSRIELSPQTIDFIVFWSKNPAPMLNKLDQLKPYPYYIQFTINAYDSLIEKNLPPKNKLIETFQKLSDKAGSRNLIWRYSPVLLTEKYTITYHLDFFASVCRQLCGYTHKCNLSFIDMYPKIQARMKALGVVAPDAGQKKYMATQFAKIAADSHISLGACGNLDLVSAGIEKSYCIDAQLISQITGKKFDYKKDPNQRRDCYCMPSIDIGTYDTCLNGCQYCYANAAFSKAERNMQKYDPNAPLLCGTISEQDKISDRKVGLLVSSQGELFA